MKQALSLLSVLILIAFSVHPRHAFRQKRGPRVQGHVLLPSKRSLERKGYVRPLGPKKKIVVFSSTGGGGHASVAHGLCKYLGDQYDITVLNALKTVHAPIDTLGTLTFGKVCGEDLYNFFLRCGWTNLIGHYAQGGQRYMSWRHNVLVKLTTGYFRDAKPDLIISVMPYINGALLEATSMLDIPFLVVTNDLDTSNYTVGLKEPYYKKFRYTLAFDDKELWDKIASACIPRDQVVVTGFPLRPEFFAPKNIPKLKKKFEIPPHKPVVMVFMGGAGSQASYRYVRNLARLGVPMHIIVCLGRNERLKRNISKILLPEGVTISIFGFTNQIAELMATSDVLITKPGPNSVCEGLLSRVPMILDMCQGTIYWEQLNIDFMVKHGFAEALTNYDDLARILPKYFKDRTYTDAIKKRMAGFSCTQFDQSIVSLVNSMTGVCFDTRGKVVS